MDLKTPGRDDSDEVKLYNRSDVEAKKVRTIGRMINLQMKKQ